VHSDFAREIDREKEAYRKIVYLKALADYDRKDLTRSTEYLTRAESDYDAITSEVQKVDKAHRDKRSEYVILSSNMESRERDLSKLRRKKEREADKLVTLSEAARQMEELISRLEQARADRERADIKTEFDFATGNFAGYKGGLPTPLRGKITSGYGWKQDPITALKSFSPGIEIKGSSNSPVIAVADGVVAYTGALRGYGNFAIIEHEDGYYSMTAGLDMVAVEKGQIVSRGQILGKTQTGRIKFELRQGRSSVDPVEWIRIDSFK
jgi:murein DD-endopeptidase MepM/ murein hydrolase activator NlpD